MQGSQWGLSAVDIGLLVFLAISVGVGLMRGVVFEVLALAGWFVASFVAHAFTPAAQAYIHIGEPGSALNHGLSWAGVFVAALLIWGLGARLVRALIRATPLSPIDRVLGAGFGMLRGLVVLLVVTLLVGMSPLSDTAAWRASQGAGWLSGVLQGLRAVFTSEANQHLPA